MYQNYTGYSRLMEQVPNNSKQLPSERQRGLGDNIDPISIVSVRDYKNPLHLDVVDWYLRRMGDYKNPLHLDVVDRYLRRMGDKTIPDEAPCLVHQ